MNASGKIGSNGIQVSDNVEKRFETHIYIYIYIYIYELVIMVRLYRISERNLNEAQWEDRKQWSLGVGQRKKVLKPIYIYRYIYLYI